MCLDEPCFRDKTVQFASFHQCATLTEEPSYQVAMARQLYLIYNSLSYGLTSIQLLLTIPLFSTGPLPFFISPFIPVIPFPSFIPPFIRTAGFSSSLRSNLSSLGPNCIFYPWTSWSKRLDIKKVRLVEGINYFFLLIWLF